MIPPSNRMALLTLLNAGEGKNQQCSFGNSSSHSQGTAVHIIATPQNILFGKHPPLENLGKENYSRKLRAVRAHSAAIWGIAKKEWFSEKRFLLQNRTSVWKSSYTSRKNCRGNKQLYGCTKPPPSLPLLQALYDLNLATAHTVSYLFTSEPKSSRNSTFRCENVTLIFIDNEPLTALSKQLKMFSSFCVRSPQYSISSKLRYSFVFSCTKKKKRNKIRTCQPVALGIQHWLCIYWIHSIKMTSRVYIRTANIYILLSYWTSLIWFGAQKDQKWSNTTKTAVVWS